MRSDAIAAVVDGAIPLLGGLYGALLGFRVLGKRPGQDLRWDAWHERYGAMLKVVGPLVALFGVYRIAMGLMKMG